MDVKSGEDVNALIVSEAEDTGEVAEEYGMDDEDGCDAVVECVERDLTSVGPFKEGRVVRKEPDWKAESIDEMRISSRVFYEEVGQNKNYRHILTGVHGEVTLSVGPKKLTGGTEMQRRERVIVRQLQRH